MPALDNARYELFSVLVAKGAADQAECYRRAGFKPGSQSAAEMGASRLIRVDQVAGRVAELKASFEAAARTAIAVTTTDIITTLDGIARYDIGDIMDWKWRGKGARRRLVAEVKDLKDISPRARLGIKSVTVGADGAMKLTFSDRVQASRLIGQHLGMFQDESAGGTTIIDNSRTTLFVDAPAAESVEDWQARVLKQRGMKLVEGKSGG